MGSELIITYPQSGRLFGGPTRPIGHLASVFERGGNSCKRLRTSTCNPGPESGRGCLVCAIFAPKRRTPKFTLCPHLATLLKKHRINDGKCRGCRGCREGPWHLRTGLRSGGTFRPGTHPCTFSHRLAFRVWGLECGVWDVGSGVWSLKFEV